MAATAAATAVLPPRVAAVATKTPVATSMAGHRQQPTINKHGGGNGDGNGDNDSGNDDDENGRQRQLGGSCGSAAVAAAARRWLRNRIKGTPISLFSETHHVCPLQILQLSPQGWW